MKRPGLRELAAIIGLAAIYFCAGKLGLSLAYVHASASAVWPPTGIAFAALLLWGYRLWPGIFLGAFLVNITTPGSVATTLAVAAGNTLEALLGAWAIHRFANGEKVFERARNIFRFVVLTPILSTAVSATLGVTSLTLGGFAQWDQYPAVWLTWWLGDAVGDLIVAPLLVIWLTMPSPRWKARRVAEAAALLLSLILVAYLMFLLGTPVSSGYMMVLPLLWAAFRFGQRGAVTSAFIMSAIALVGTLHGVGPFAHATANESLLHLQAFMGTIAIAALVLASVISEASRAEQRLQVQEAVSRILAESPALKEAASEVIQVLCERAGWDLGAIWNIDQGTDQLHSVEVWHRPAVEAPQFEAVTKDGKFASGEGLPGRVWSTGKATWIPDVTTDSNFKRAAVATEEGLHSAFGFPIKLGDKALAVIECFSREVREPDENFLRMVSDIGGQLGQFVERKRAEGLSLDSEKRLRAVVETAVDGIITIDEHGAISTVNPAAERIFGYRAAELIGQNIRMLMPEPYQAEHASYIGNYLRTGERKIIGIGREVQEQLEEQLRQAQKMESIGTLAGGIAHDFNNILNIIRGYATLIGQQPTAGWQITKSLKVIDQEIERGASVVRQLLAVARKTETHLAPLDVNDIVLKVCELIKTFPKTITVALNLERDVPSVLADPNQMSRALLNVCVNARDAMPTGGQLSIRTETVDANKVRDRRFDGGVNGYICIAVSDTGTGMKDEVRGRIFEPFFTTKGIGEGTGLGLAIVYSIIKEHNGLIEVESVAGHGATFRLYLPIQSGEQSVANAPKKSAASGGIHASRSGTVLVVEDEAALVQLLKKLLSQAGYRVLAAMDGEEAIDLYQKHKTEIDVVLLDLGLPKITGFDVIPRLKEQNPGVNIIITTGYLEADLKAKLFRTGVKDCIHKPYLVDDVIERIGTLLENSWTASNEA